MFFSKQKSNVLLSSTVMPLDLYFVCFCSSRCGFTLDGGAGNELGVPESSLTLSLSDDPTPLFLNLVSQIRVYLTCSTFDDR